jgi:hypothetical protein
MPHLPLKPTLLLILTLFLSSCAPQPTPNPALSNIEGLIPSIEPTLTSTPVLSTVEGPTLPTPAPTQKPRGQNPPQGQGSDASQSLDFEIPSHPYDVILGRPTISTS